MHGRKARAYNLTLVRFKSKDTFIYAQSYICLLLDGTWISLRKNVF